MTSSHRVVRERGLFKLRGPNGERLPLHKSGAEYCCERERDLDDLIAVAKRDGVL